MGVVLADNRDVELVSVPLVNERSGRPAHFCWTDSFIRVAVQISARIQRHGRFLRFERCQDAGGWIEREIGTRGQIFPCRASANPRAVLEAGKFCDRPFTVRRTARKDFTNPLGEAGHELLVQLCLAFCVSFAPAPAEQTAARGAAPPCTDEVDFTDAP